MYPMPGQKLAGASSVEQMAEGDAELTGALSRLLVVVENYPDLKADANFRQLSDNLSGTENRISVARRITTKLQPAIILRSEDSPLILWPVSLALRRLNILRLRKAPRRFQR